MSTLRTEERIKLGAALRQHRLRSNRTQLEVARLLDCAESKVSKIEEGIAKLNASELSDLLRFLQVSEKTSASILILGAQAARKLRRKPSEYKSYEGALSNDFLRRANLEVGADTICTYSPGVIPGLLQSPTYVHAVIKAGDGVFWEKSDAEVEHRVKFRRDRQRAVLADECKQLQFVFTSDTLEASALYVSVLREQLKHLLGLLDSHPNLTIQLVHPMGGLDNPISSGGLTVLDFESIELRIAFAHVIYGPAVYLDSDMETAGLTSAFNAVRELALSPEDSAKYIRRKLEALNGA
ncbi:helix-turn-helix transcriptional regulator [Crossiella sp. SN42]|uniref:helix-turn-helix domain-containing protein n=1 Tax=Crossiella sp. SN42 TaxID=2944808 RepID=UPI00207CFF60|nr:helix-turn-helix transcriptional regulator [Crossiella sp. SN42]MCO1577797.1 helix-turn-helix transcriptional regulator [Crossiella sp. SN42]